MKAPFLLSISIFLSSLLVSGTSFTQGNNAKTLSMYDYMASARNVNAKVIRTFLEKFKNVEFMEWKEINNNFFVKFTMNNQTNNALFNKGGILIYHISYGTEKNLPAEIRKRIKTNPYYFDCAITDVFKVYQDNRSFWIIHLDDSRTLYHIKVENDSLEEMIRYKKALNTEQ